MSQEIIKKSLKHHCINDSNKIIQQSTIENHQTLAVKSLRGNDDKNKPSRKPVSEKALQKYHRGSSINVKNFGKVIEHRMKVKETQIKEAEEESARAEILLTENPGLLEATDTSYTSHITQKELRDSVDITAATKSFDLHLNDFGPYKFRYSRDGRHMVLGGLKGHLASFDWITKGLHSEINTMEYLYDVCFLHTEQMMAAAQKEWTYIYDHTGVELHCLKQLHRILRLEFLPYHFLLCAGSENGYLSWLDVTLGKEVLSTKTKKGKIDVMCQNPSNAVICVGQRNGTVTMWTPNVKEAVISTLCHPQAIRAIDVDPTGRYLATGCIDRLVRIWDTRNLGKVVSSYRISGGATHMAFSQRQLLSLSYRNIVEVYKNVTLQEECEIYMKHQANSIVTDLQFCPYEDVLGCSTGKGFSSLLIPGSGEPNFDALEANPFRSTSARREMEVKALLEKIPYDLITLDPLTVAQVDVPTLEEKLEAKKQLHWVKVPKVDVQPRYRMKGKSGSANRFKRKLIVKEQEQREYLKFIKHKKQNLEKQSQPQEEAPPQPTEILDRFKPKRKKKI